MRDGTGEHSSSLGSGDDLQSRHRCGTLHAAGPNEGMRAITNVSGFPEGRVTSPCSAAGLSYCVILKSYIDTIVHT